MSKTGEIPHSWEEIENQIREAILAQASILGCFGPWVDGAFIKVYLGADFDEWDYHDMTKEQIASIDIKRHNLYDLARKAYIYAYQLDGAESVGADDWYEVSGVLEGFPQADLHGERSPLCTLNDFPLRRMLETFFARWSLNVADNAVTIRELSLLANMTVPAVRTSLSKEGFKLEKWRNSKDEESNYRLPSGDALLWLSRRRGYIPNRSVLGLDDRGPVMAQILSNTELDFLSVLTRILEFTGHTTESLAQKSGQNEEWLRDLLAGKAVATNLAALRALAEVLAAPVPEFVGQAVKHLLVQELRV